MKTLKELTIVEARKFSGQVWVSNKWHPSMVQPNYFTSYLDILAVVLKREGHRERRAADDCGCTSKNECLLGQGIREQKLFDPMRSSDDP